MNNLHSCLPFPVKVMATSGSCVIAEDVCRELAHKLPANLHPEGGLVLARPKVDIFSNGNLEVQVPNVRGHYVTIVHTSTPRVNEELIELFALVQAVVNASPANLLVVFPNYPYARSDRQDKPRISVMSEALAIMLNALGVKKVILVDPHDPHIKHYFRPRADEITTVYLLIDYLKTHFFTKHDQQEVTLVFPDEGASKRFKYVPKILGVPKAYIDKTREDNDENPLIGPIVGEVSGRHCIMLDDETLTGETALRDAEKIMKEGALSVSLAAVHAFVRDKVKPREELIDAMEQSSIEQFIFTDTIPADDIRARGGKFTVLSTAGFIAEAVSRTVKDESLTALYDPKAVDFYRVEK